MILTIDIGNSNIVVGVYRETNLVKFWRLSTRPHSTAAEYGVWLKLLFEQNNLDLAEIRGAVMASVVPPLIVPWQEMLQEMLPVDVFLFEPDKLSVMDNLYEHPSEVGSDRIINALAGREKYGAPLVVVDFGTATTFDVVNREGAYLGGAIAPGIGISTEALFAHAAKLPRIELIRPQQAIGRNSVASMQSGIIFGFAGHVDAMVRRIWQELGEKTKVIATGGFAELIAAESETIDAVEPLLSLEGLRIIYEKFLKDTSSR